MVYRRPIRWWRRIRWQEGDEELKEGKGLKNLTPRHILPRLSILLAQIAAKQFKKFQKWKQANTISFVSAL